MYLVHFDTDHFGKARFASESVACRNFFLKKLFDFNDSERDNSAEEQIY